MATIEQIIEATKSEVRNLMNNHDEYVAKRQEFAKFWYKIGGIELYEKDLKLRILDTYWQLTKDQYADLAKFLDESHQVCIDKILNRQTIESLAYIGL